jgi:hypothetical protein
VTWLGVQLPAGHSPQLVIDDRQQLVGCTGVTAANPLDDQRDVVHRQRGLAREKCQMKEKVEKSA